MSIAHVSACYIYWRECIARLKISPDNQERQFLAMRAQSQLIMVQAVYMAGVKS